MTDFNQKTHDTDVGSHGGQSRQMMDVFENQEFGSIRLLQEAGKTFFCASDVAKALGYVNPYAAVKRHCRGPLTKREGVVQKVNQYGDAGEQVVEISFSHCPPYNRLRADLLRSPSRGSWQLRAFPLIQASFVTAPFAKKLAARHRSA